MRERGVKKAKATSIDCLLQRPGPRMEPATQVGAHDWESSPWPFTAKPTLWPLSQAGQGPAFYTKNKTKQNKPTTYSNIL